MRQVSSWFVVLLRAPSSALDRAASTQPVAALRGEPALELALRKLDTVGNFMMTTAHPDDENNAMLAYFAHGKGIRTSLVTATHGEGGQNEIGPELFVPLAVLRTEELLAAHRFDGAEQYFTRAIDFGFSFSIEETLEKWGHQEILGDYVRMIRTIRPDVIVGFVFDGDGGGQHHQTSSRLTLEAFRAAADPAKFPEQIKEGLRPWQARSSTTRRASGASVPRVRRLAVEAPRMLNFTGGDVSSIPCSAAPTTRSAARRAACTSARACRSCCRCRWRRRGRWGRAAARVSVARHRARRRRTARRTKEIFDGVDTSLAAWRASRRQCAGGSGTAPRRDCSGGRRGARALAAGGSAAAVAPLARGLAAVRELRGAALASLAETTRFEIDFRLAQKERSSSRRCCWRRHAPRRIARDGLVAAGQPGRRAADRRRRGRRAGEGVVAVNGFDGDRCPTTAKAWRSTSRAAAMRARALAFPANAKLTAAHFRRNRPTARAIASIPTCRSACRSGRRRSRRRSP